MAKSNWDIDRRDKNQLLEEILDITTGHSHDGTDSRKTAYSTVKAGIQAMTCATQLVSLTTIAAADIVLANIISYATAAYVAKLTITASTGFLITLNTDSGPASVSYAVFKAS